MLNEEKIILMTKLAIYEKGEGKKEIPMSRYYRNDYVGVHMLYTFLSVTAGYVLLFALYIAKDVEEFLSSLTTMDIKKFLFTALAIYIAAELFFLFVTWLLYRHRFKKNRQHLNEYYGNLKALKKLQKKEQAAAMKMVAGKEAEGTEMSGVSGEDAGEDDLYSEEPGEDDIFGEPEQKKQKRYFRRRGADRDEEDEDPDGETGEDLYGGEEEDPYDWEETPKAAEEPDTDRTQGDSLKPEQNIDPDLALKQALKKMLQEDSEDDEEDEDGFTFSS